MSTRTKFNGRMSFAPNPLEFEMNFWIKFAFCLLLATCSFSLAGSRAEACGGRAVGAVLRVGTAPVRLARKVQLNSLQRRASRGNTLAAARVCGVSQRKAARACR